MVDEFANNQLTTTITAVTLLVVVHGLWLNRLTETNTLHNKPLGSFSFSVDPLSIFGLLLFLSAAEF